MTSHSQILVPPECGFIIWLYAEYGDWHLIDSMGTIKLDTFIDDLFKCKKMDTWGINKTDVKKQILIHQPISYPELCAVIYATYALNIGKSFRIWGDKNNFYLYHLDELLELYENARFLHVVRDGRDVACSYREVMHVKMDSPYAPKLETDVGDIAMKWAGNIIKIDSFMSLLSSHNAMTIKYEDLVTEPLNIISDICKWADIPFEAGMLDFYKNNKKNRLEPKLTMDWKKRTLKPISSETVGRYVQLLSKKEQSEFNESAYDALNLFGYV